MKLRPVSLRPSRWSVRTRLGAVSTITAIIGLTVAGSTAYAVTSRVLQQQLDDSLRNSPRVVGGSVAPVPDVDQLCQMIESSVAPSPSVFVLTVVTPDGTVCSDPRTSPIRLSTDELETLPRRPADKVSHGELADGRDVHFVAVPLETDEGFLVIARDATSVNSVLTTLRWTLLGVILLGGMIALGLNRWVAGAGLRPITRFTRIAEDIAATGNVEQHASSVSALTAGHHGDELDRLADAFGTMTSVLAEAQARQRRLVADAGHELRTPLSSVRSNIELLRRSRRLHRPLKSGEEERLLRDLDDQITELAYLIDDVVQLSADHETDALERHVRFDQCVEDALSRARRRTTGHEFNVRLEPWVVDGDAGALERAAVNLLDNAIKFSSPSSQIDVTLSDGELRIADLGSGVSEDDGPRAFERFWRSPSARSLPGSGLGLSIVAEVAEQHGGLASLSPREGGGTVATLFIPGAPLTTTV